jgi:hypothetical protein
MEGQQENGYQESREDSLSPTVALESIMLTGVIDARDIPNAFIQALMPEIKTREERVMMKITGVLIDTLVKLNPELYGPYVVYEKKRKIHIWNDQVSGKHDQKFPQGTQEH